MADAYSADEYVGLMDRFKKEKIPLSVGVIDIDWYGSTFVHEQMSADSRHLIDVPAEYGTGWTGYTWDKKLFPDHVKFLKELHDRDLKVSLNVHPADGVRSFESAYEEICKVLKRDSSNGVVSYRYSCIHEKGDLCPAFAFRIDQQGIHGSLLQAPASPSRG